MEYDQLIELFKSGNFTILCYDRDQYFVYEGKYETFDDIPEETQAVWGSDTDSTGYMPHILAMLVDALDGEIDTI